MTAKVTTARPGWAYAGILAALAVIAGCSDTTAPSSETHGNLTVETSRAGHDSIGPAGGEITATSQSGIVYTLTVPAGALQAPVKITMTPVSAQAALPGQSQFAAGVEFQPDGLALINSAVLTAHGVPAVPAGQLPIAVSYQAGGNSLALTPAAGGGTDLTVVVQHFSGTSFIYGTTADLNLLVSAIGTSPVEQNFIDQLVALGTLNGTPLPAAEPILRSWFMTLVQPELQGAGTDAELLIALHDYTVWRDFASSYLVDGTVALASLFPAPPESVTPVSDLEELARQAVAPQLRHAIEGNNAECRSQRSVQAMLNVLFLQSMAQFFEVDTQGESLDRATVINGLCGRVVADQVSLADPLPSHSTSLDIVWGVLIGSSPPVLPADFKVTTTASGAGIGTASGFTGAGGGVQHGFFTTVVTPGSQSVSIHSTACLVIPGTTTPIPDLCGSTTVSRGGGGALPTGKWEKDDSNWFFTGAPAQPRGIRFDIFVATDNSTHLKGFQPPVTPDQEARGVSLFDIPITSTDGKHFTGTIVIPESEAQTKFFAGWTMTVSGEILQDGSMDMQWSGFITSTPGQRVSGSDVLPKIG